MPTIYTAEALSTGAGRNGHVATTTGYVDLDLAIPKEMGGAGDATNPEELFAAGYAACFHSALQAVARAQKIRVNDTSVGSRVHVIPIDAGFKLAVDLEVVIPDLEHTQAEQLVEAAHAMCPYSNATRGNIDVAITVTDD